MAQSATADTPSILRRRVLFTRSLPLCPASESLEGFCGLGRLASHDDGLFTKQMTQRFEQFLARLNFELFGQPQAQGWLLRDVHPEVDRYAAGKFRQELF